MDYYGDGDVFWTVSNRANNEIDKIYKRITAIEKRCRDIEIKVGAILKEPSAVTKCGDCDKHYTADCPLHFEYDPLDDWFCGDGERRSE